MVAKKKAAEEKISVIKIKREKMQIAIVGETPMIMHRLTEKARKELLLPSPKKTAGDKKNSLKHDPHEEFQECAYISEDFRSQTLLQMPSTAFKDALRSCAVDLPGSSSKAQLGRLTFVNGDFVPIYGIPKLHMSIVRMKDINRTPDVRTRIILERWCAIVPITYTVPILNKDAIVNLFGAAGIIQGVGDYRTEKGKGNYGSWRLADLKDPEFLEIKKEGSRKNQMKAMENPECYDKETRDLLAWFDEEVDKRGFPTMKPEDKKSRKAS